MMRACILALVAAGLSMAAQPEPIRLKWADAARLIEGKQIEITLASGGSRKGKATSIGPGSISFERGRPASVARADIAEIKLLEYLGNGRRNGRLVGGAIGLLGGLLGAVAVGMDETSSHKDRDKAVAATLAIGGLPVGLLAGHFVGRAADKQVTIIRIIPE